MELKLSLLCMRRDVSGEKKDLDNYRLSSLHAQRCFQSITLTVSGFSVFSACAEMFLIRSSTLMA